MKRLSTVWAIAIFAFAIAAALLADDLITTSQRDAARAEAADLRKQLEEQISGHNGCLKRNVELMQWKLDHLPRRPIEHVPEGFKFYFEGELPH